MDWPRGVYLCLEWLWVLGGTACLAAAGALILRPKLAWPAPSPRLLWAVPALVCLYKLAQYPSFALGYDSGVMANVVWNFAHGHGWTTSILSDSNFIAFHFAFTLAFLAPLLWLWPSTLALTFVQGAALGSIAAAVYRLGRLHSRKRALAWLLAMLAVANPLFRELIGTFLDSSLFATPLFLWAAWCWESGRKRAALVLAALLATTQEQAPFLFAGLGLMIAARADNARGRRLGAAVSAGALLVFFAELAAQSYFRRTWTYFPNHWLGLYGAFGQSSGEVVATVLRRPWLAAGALVWPPIKLWAPARTFLSLALLPLFGGTSLLPALAVWLPQQLALPTVFQDLKDHYATFVAGPLFWAAAHGLGRVEKRLSSGGLRRLAACLLAVCAGSFFASAHFVPVFEPILEPWRAAAPKALSLVAPGARLWCDELLMPQTAMRRHLKALPWYDDRVYFEEGLFVPDRVILSLRWLKMADPGNRGRVTGFLARRKFKPIFNEGGLIVLANPATNGDGSETLVPARLDD